MELAARATGGGPVAVLARERDRPALDDATLERYWLIVAIFAFRALSLPSGVVPLVLAVGLREAMAPMLVALVVAAGCLVVVLRATPTMMTGKRPLVAALVCDLLLAVGLNLWASQVIPLPATETGFGLFWPMMQGSVVLALAIVGLPAALMTIAVGILVNLIMLATAPVPTAAGAAAVLGYAGWLLLALIAAQVVRAIAQSRAKLALSRGREAGEQAERVRSLRRLHDTALQSMKSIALLSSADELDDTERLRTIGKIARAESAMLRRLVDDSTPPTLLAELGSLVEFSCAVGTPAELTTTGDIPRSLPPDVHEACAGAVLEALTNARHHAAPSTVTVLVAGAADAVRVDVTDDGCGFVPSMTWSGFGLRQSIVGRVSEVGGVATIRSAPGDGTTVSLHFPLPDVSTGSRNRAVSHPVTTPHPGSRPVRRRRLAVGRPA